MTAALPAGTTYTMNPGMVDFRLQTGWGIQCQRVLLTGSEPRFMSWSEKPSASGVEVAPLAAKLSDIELYVQFACQLYGEPRNDVMACDED